MRLFQAYFVPLHNKTITKMKIYTSYFANSRALNKAGIMQVSIARYSPKWFYGPRYTDVAPTGYMLSSVCSHEEYLRMYDEILKKLNPQTVVAAVEKIAQGRDVALCCYEKPGDFCHRHLLSEWLRKNGYEVKEWKPEDKNGQTQQLSLFD